MLKDWWAGDREDCVEFLEDEFVNTVRSEWIGCRRVMMRVTDDKCAVGALHDDQVYAALELRALLLDKALPQRRRFG